MNPAKLRSLLILVICCLHAGMLILSILPAGSPRFSGPGFLRNGLNQVQGILGTHQDWTMFFTIQTFRSLDVTVRTNRGKVFGATLPGLQGDATKHRPRFLYFFANLDFPKNEMIRTDWILGLGEALSETGDESFTIHYDRLYTRHLFHAKKDRQTHKLISESRGPFPIPAR